MKNFPRILSSRIELNGRKKSKTCKKYRLLELLRFLHSRNNRIYKLDTNLTSLYTI